MSLKDIGDAAGVEGCRYSKLIESPNQLNMKIFATSKVDGPATSILDPSELPSSFLASSSSSDSRISLSASPYNNKL